MSDDMSDLSRALDLALKLPPAARAALAGTLLDSLDAIDEEAEAGWAVELARRVADLESGAVRTVPWSEVRRRLSGE